MIRKGIFCQYLGKEYMVAKSFKSLDIIIFEKDLIHRLKPSFYENYYKNLVIEPGDIELWSSDRIDLEKSFHTIQDGVNGFTCMKVVHKNEIMGAYRYETHAVYKGIKCYIVGPIPDKNAYFLETYDEIYVDDPLYPIFTELGFSMGRDIGYGKYTYCIYVSPDDPDLQVFEERTEIDVDSL